MRLALLFACTGGGDSADLACLELSQTSDESEVYEDTGAAAVPSGFDYCWADDAHAGALDRADAVACETDPRENVHACDYSDEGSACSEDADCGEGAFCGYADWGGCTCYSACASDADCADGEACICSAMRELDGSIVGTHAWNQCLPADCRSGDDCASGSCGLSRDVCAWYPERLACRTDEDECRTDADCGYDQCRYDEDAARWTCQGVATCD